MSVVNLPGLWDQIGPSAMGFAENLQRAVAPNFYAKKKLEEIMQKDPTMVAKVANMGREEQAQLAQALGFRNENPFAPLPMGLERQDALQTAAMKTEAIGADKEGVAQRMFGARPKTQIAVDALKPQAAKVDLNNSILQGKQAEKNLVLSDQSMALNGFKLEQADIDMREQKRLKGLFPDLSKVDLGELADSIVLGKPVNNDLLAAIETSKFSDTFKEYVQNRKIRLQLSAEKAMRMAKTPSDLAQAMGVMESIYNKSFAEYTKAQTALDAFDKENGMLVNGNTVVGKKLTSDRAVLEGRLNTLKKQVDADETGMRTGFKMMTGKDLPIVKPDTTGAGGQNIAPPSPKVATAIERIQKGIGTLEQAKAAGVFTPEELTQIEASITKK